jgi:hypothetical protein
MPCRDYGGEMASERDSTQDRLDKVTRLLCEVLTTVELMEDGEREFFHVWTSEVSEWWNKHKEADRQRKANEALLRLNELEHKVFQIKNLGGYAGDGLLADIHTTKLELEKLKK